MSREIVLKVVESLNSHAIPYMLVGSFSTNFYGTERSTKDADLVIALGNRGIGDVFRSLGPEFRCDPQMTMETVTGTMRYVISHTASAFQVELFLLSDEAHDRERFRRRLEVDYLGARVWVPTVEDAIIMKLRWSKRARRPKDEQDIVAVLAVQRSRLDLAYIRHWCDIHESREIFERLFAATEAKFV